ncbi:hypothetical protein OCK74_08840 [Chitinophagaceae bacterium LB-8]|uniref:Uncharacterized protein n=1 Tax=Paraflavisolibacter caeni TaxID=2982496 RepID=A0A9X2XV32_9BACT|nr:hypothetical protein [Paraflavisolibacter caeni]MCU7549220.1 hypothetical protein [Paraflavisolibacter caeni]
MKKLLFLFIVTSIIQSCKESKKDFTSVKWVQFDLDNRGEIISKGDTIAIEYYSEGILLRKVTYDSADHKRRIKKEAEYNSHGKETAYSFQIDNTLADRTEILRDTNGNIVKLKMYDLRPGSDTSTLIYKNSYKADTIVLKSEVWDKEFNSLKMILEYDYDSNNRLTAMRTFMIVDTTKTLQSREKYEYDLHGNKTQEIVENPIASTVVKKVYKYDLGNNLLSESLFDGERLVYNIKYSYENGLKKEAIQVRGLEKNKIKFIYE